MNEYGYIASLIAALLAFIFFIFQSYTQKYGAPWVPTSHKKIEKMLTLAEVKPDDTVYDLGSGDGRVIIDTAILFGAKAVGIEIDLLRFIWTKAKIIYLGLSGRVNVLHGNFFNINISNADVVTIYLLQETNIKLTYKFINELRPGTRIVSNTFTLPGLKIISSDEKDKIYVYII